MKPSYATLLLLPASCSTVRNAEISSLAAEDQAARTGSSVGRSDDERRARDRYLSFTVGTQRYGTNRMINQSSGTEELVPIDRSVSDAERKLYGVAPLQELLSRYPEQSADSSSSATRRD